MGRTDNYVTALACAISIALGLDSASAATITVTSGADAGTPETCTLHQAVASANNDAAGSSTCVAGSGSDTIVFAPELQGSAIAINLAGAPLNVTHDLTIVGNGQFINAQFLSRVLEVSNASLMVSNLSLYQGTTDEVGSALYATDSTVNLDTVFIFGNIVNDHDGAALTVHRGTLAMNKVTITDNTGTGLEADHAAVYASDLVVSGNSGMSVGGVKIVNTADATAVLVRSDISGNSCLGNGCAGGIGVTFGSIKISYSTISGNSASQGDMNALSVGGMLFLNAAATMANSTVANNSAHSSQTAVGAIAEVDNIAGHAHALVNCTITSNHATGGVTVVGGILAGDPTTMSFTGSLNVYNTIASANTPQGTDLLADADPIEANYSLLGAALDAPPLNDVQHYNIFTDDPKLDLLQQNGGPTATMLPHSGSLALNKGDNARAALSGEALQFDQRGDGFPRIMGGIVDIGAAEAFADPIFKSGFE